MKKDQQKKNESYKEILDTVVVDKTQQTFTRYKISKTAREK